MGYLRGDNGDSGAGRITVQSTINNVHFCERLDLDDSDMTRNLRIPRYSTNLV